MHFVEDQGAHRLEVSWSDVVAVLVQGDFLGHGDVPFVAGFNDGQGPFRTGRNLAGQRLVKANQRLSGRGTHDALGVGNLRFQARLEGVDGLAVA